MPFLILIPLITKPYARHKALWYGLNFIDNCEAKKIIEGCLNTFPKYIFPLQKSSKHYLKFVSYYI